MCDSLIHFATRGRHDFGALSRVDGAAGGRFLGGIAFDGERAQREVLATSTTEHALVPTWRARRTSRRACHRSAAAGRRAAQPGGAPSPPRLLDVLELAGAAGARLSVGASGRAADYFGIRMSSAPGRLGQASERAPLQLLEALLGAADTGRRCSRHAAVGGWNSRSLLVEMQRVRAISPLEAARRAVGTPSERGLPGRPTRRRHVRRPRRIRRRSISTTSRVAWRPTPALPRRSTGFEPRP